MVETENKTVPEIQVKEQKQRTKKSGRKAYIIILAVIVAVCCIHAVYQLTNSVSATVMINSIFSADGQNPDGTPFSIMELFNDDVMNSASDKLNGALSAKEIRNHLAVSDAMNGESFAKLVQSILDGENENTYFPTKYILTYSTVSEQIKSEGFLAQCESLWKSFFLPSKTEILKAVLQSYEEYYTELYLSYDSLFEIDWSVVDSMDYYNRFEYMDDTIQRLMRFLQYKNTRSMAQNETYTNPGYYDLIVELSNGPAHGINDYQAYVTQNGVTNNREELLRQFIYMQELCEEENARKLQEYDVLKKAIEMYDSTTTKVVFIPALDDSKEFYMNRTNIGLDYLSEKADAAKLQADTAIYSAKHYSYLQTCFATEDIIDEDGNKVKVKNTPDQRAHADGLYEKLKDELQRLIGEVAALADEGKQLDRENLDISEPFNSVNIVGVGISTAKKFVLLTMAAYVAVYAVMAVYRKKQKSEGGKINDCN